MASEYIRMTLAGLTFGQRSGVMRTEVEEDGVVAISYGVEPTAEATVEVDSSLLSAPCRFTVNVALGGDGVDAAVGQARAAVHRFLAELAQAEFET